MEKLNNAEISSAYNASDDDKTEDLEAAVEGSDDAHKAPEIDVKITTDAKAWNEAANTKIAEAAKMEAQAEIEDGKRYKALRFCNGDFIKMKHVVYEILSNNYLNFDYTTLE